MPKFTVITSRTELISYEIDARDTDDAAARYLRDGEEVGSKTTDTIVTAVQEITDAP